MAFQCPDRWERCGPGFDHLLQDFRAVFLSALSTGPGHGEPARLVDLARAVDADEQMWFAFGGLHLGDVDPVVRHLFGNRRRGPIGQP